MSVSLTYWWNGNLVKIYVFLAFLEVEYNLLFDMSRNVSLRPNGLTMNIVYRWTIVKEFLDGFFSELLVLSLVISEWLRWIIYWSILLLFQILLYFRWFVDLLHEHKQNWNQSPIRVTIHLIVRNFSGEWFFIVIDAFILIYAFYTKRSCRLSFTTLLLCFRIPCFG